MRTNGSQRLRLAILNDSPHVLKLLCVWVRRHGYQCATQMVGEMPHAHVEVEQFKGRDTGASTDASLRAEMLSYSRSRGGLFAGVSLESTSLRPDDDARLNARGLRLRWSSAKLSSSRLAECDEVLFGE